MKKRKVLVFINAYLSNQEKKDEEIKYEYLLLSSYFRGGGVAVLWKGIIGKGGDIC